MISFVIQHHPHGTLAHLRGKLVRRFARHGSILFGSWSLRQTRGGSGSEFSVIKADNATGNFTKVAQRIPVRIAIDTEQPLVTNRLVPGMSVIASVDLAQTANAN
jgi:hypothetical protein